MLTPYKNKLSLWNKIGRILWQITWLLLFRFSPIPLHRWRIALLRLFGATIEKGVHIYPSVKIWAPWNLTVKAHGCLAQNVDCYCVAPIYIGAQATVSQYSYLCTASHNIDDPEMPLITAPIHIEDGAWVAAAVFVGPGVTIAEYAVVGARSVVIKDIAAWDVVAGNPAHFIKKRHRS